MFRTSASSSVFSSVADLVVCKLVFPVRVLGLYNASRCTMLLLSISVMLVTGRPTSTKYQTPTSYRRQLHTSQSSGAAPSPLNQAPCAALPACGAPLLLIQSWSWLADGARGRRLRRASSNATRREAGRGSFEAAAREASGEPHKSSGAGCTRPPASSGPATGDPRPVVVEMDVVV